MSEPEAPAILSYQVLADPTGRRRRRMAIAGRVATTSLGLWLVVLILGGLGVQPLAGLPIIGDLGTREAAPPVLPERVQTAVIRRSTLAPATRTAPTARAPVTTAPASPRRAAVTPVPHATTRPGGRSRHHRRSPATPTPTGTSGDSRSLEPSSPAPTPETSPNPPPGQGHAAPGGGTRTPPGRGPAVPAPAHPTNPSSTAPGRTTPPARANPGSGVGPPGAAHADVNGRTAGANRAEQSP
jgi:hypothetical protein